MGFGPFKLPTRGLLQKGHDHSPPKACNTIYGDKDLALYYTAHSFHETPPTTTIKLNKYKYFFSIVKLDNIQEE